MKEKWMIVILLIISFYGYKSKESEYLATSDNVKIIGRYYQNDDITWLIHSGSAIEFYITGNSATVLLVGDGAIYNDEKYRPRYAVYLDGKIVEDSLMGELQRTVTLFEDEEKEKVKAKVMLLSENMDGGIGVKTIVVDSSSNKPITPVEKKNLSIEFIGDSITCGYGVEGKSQYENFQTSTENFSKSYAYLTAQKLDADYVTVSYSGSGIVSGYSTGEKNSDNLFPGDYEKLSRFKDYPGEWDFTKYKHDVVVVNLGTNDNNYVTASPATRNDEFIQEYASFLEKVRKNNPESHIICTVGIMGCADIYPLIEKAIALIGDEKISSYQSPQQNTADGLGSDWHPSAITQQKNAYILSDKICQAIGRESDQVGLDVAIDAKYTAVTNSDSVTIASSWIGYDKSFWNTAGMGGSNPEDIEVIISGISLKKGGVYKLEFDYNSTEDAKIPVIIRGSSEHYSGTVNTGKEKDHYSDEIEINKDDSKAEIVFQIGGKNNFTFTLYNIFLTKIKQK